MRKVIRRAKPRLWLTILINIIIVSISIITSFIILRQIRDKYELDLKRVEDQIQSKKIYAYKARDDIIAGQTIKEEDLEYVEIYSSQASNYYFNKEHFGMISKIDVRKGTYLLLDMLAKDEKVSNLRELEYNLLYASSNLKESDYVDVRILFPNGEDYVVLSKKNLKNLNHETGNCFLWLSEKEILDMAGAIVDTYMYPGSKIYTSRYLEPQLQEASVINYKPNLYTLDLTQKNTNILRNIDGLDEILISQDQYKDNQRFRRELEFRLQDFYSKSEIDFNKPIEEIGGYGEEIALDYGGQ
ncbi:MAG: hypothetical protein GX323_00345 [Clostridiales bacterium]|nr:hypothetical protein [Clostridiales bacterium]